MRIGIAVIMLVVISAAAANAQSGGSYVMSQTVIGAFGGGAAGGAYAVDGTGGQPVAVGDSSGGGYSMAAGFWQMFPLTPTSAGIAVSGKVQDVDGRPIKNVTVMLSGGMLTSPLVVKTNNFGMFTFGSVEPGQAYVVGVVSRRFGFAEQNKVVTPLDNLSDIVFRAAWRN